MYSALICTRFRILFLSTYSALGLASICHSGLPLKKLHKKKECSSRSQVGETPWKPSGIHRSGPEDLSGPDAFYYTKSTLAFVKPGVNPDNNSSCWQLCCDSRTPSGSTRTSRPACTRSLLIPSPSWSCSTTSTYRCSRRWSRSKMLEDEASLDECQTRQGSIYH